MSIKLQAAQAILALANKGIDDTEKAITEKKIWSFPFYSQGIQTAVQEWYIRIVGNSEPPKYYLSEHGLNFVHNVLDSLEVPK